jgi:hypothetical protein
MSRDYLEESGLRLGFPAGHSFRFQDSKAYRTLCGQALKEMDFAWYQGTRLYLLVVRDYRNLQMALELDDLVPRDRVAAPRRFAALADKVTDSLLMLLAVRANTRQGQQLAIDLPALAKAHASLTLIIALGLPDHLRVHMGVIRHRLNARLKGRLALVGVSAIAVLDYQNFSQWVPRLGLECHVLPQPASS